MVSEKTSKQFNIILVLIVIILIVVFSVCLWLFFDYRKKVIYQVENGGNVFLNYVSDFNGLAFRNMIPSSDDNGIISLKSGSYFDFFIDTKLDEASIIDYEISLFREKKYAYLDKDIRIYLEEEKSGTYVKVFGPSEFIPLKKVSKYGTNVGDMVLLHVSKKNKSTNRYRLRMWLSNNSQITSGDYSVSVKLNGKAK